MQRYPAKISSNLIALLLLLLLMSTCRKDDQSDYNPFHSTINPHLYPYLFDEGSYWVYKDSLTNTLDSTIVTGISKSTYFITPSGPGEGSPGDFEYFEIDYLSFPTNTTFSEDVIANWISRELIAGGITFIAAGAVGDSAQNAKIDNILDTFSVEGHLYHNVVKMRVQADAYISGNYNLYYADSIGIIRKEIRTGEEVTQVWNLLRHSTAIKAY